MANQDIIVKRPYSNYTARAEARYARAAADREMVKHYADQVFYLADRIITNPAMALVLANLALEYIERKGYASGWGGVVRTALDAGPMSTALGSAANSLIGTIGSIAAALPK